METLMAFKYLIRVLTVGDDDWKAVAGKLQKSRKSWVQMLRIFIQEGADPKLSVHFFKAIVQAVLLFRSEAWILTSHMDQKH